jgi:transposase
MERIAFDSHKHYTLCSVEDEQGKILQEQRIEHERGAIQTFLAGFAAGTPVAVETIGNWYWIIEEIEAAGLTPRLVHARKAKVMMGCLNKTDRLDVRGLNRLQRTGTLPTVWIPPGNLRDLRDLMRTRMSGVATRTRLKNRLQATLAKYALSVKGVSDIFGKRGRLLLKQQLKQLPPQTQFAAECQLRQLEHLEEEIQLLEQRMKEVFVETEEIRLLQTLPGIGQLLGPVLALEIGDVRRFATAEKLAAYAGTTPRVHASGGRIRYGHLRPDVNRYLKWAFAEAANSIAINHELWSQRHVSRRYRHLRQKKGHATAIGAVARHLAEASYWVLKKKESYRDPALTPRFAKGSPSAQVS